jgi:hypothetical protein
LFTFTIQRSEPNADILIGKKQLERIKPYYKQKQERKTYREIKGQKQKYNQIKGTNRRKRTGK